MHIFVGRGEAAHGFNDDIHLGIIQHYIKVCDRLIAQLFTGSADQHVFHFQIRAVCVYNIHNAFPDNTISKQSDFHLFFHLFVSP